MGRTKTTKIEPAKLRALMDKYELRGNNGTEIVAKLLNVKQTTVQMYLCYGIPFQTFELLSLKLSAKK